MDATPVHPSDLCSHDEWIHVFERLNTPRDRCNASNAHPLFRSIFHLQLRKEMVSALLFGNKSILVQFLNYLPFPIVLKLRLLDKETKSAIDHCLEQGQVNALEYYCNSLRVGPRDLIPRENERYHLSTRPFKSWMNLDLHFQGIQHQHFIHFLPFFRQNGHQVYKLTTSCCMHPTNANPVTTIKNLRTILLCIENVNGIDLTICCEYPELEAPHRPWADQVTSFLESNPFPPLDNLDLVRLSLGNHENPASTAIVVRDLFLETYGPQLYVLNLPKNRAILPNPMEYLQVLEFQLETPEELASLQACGAPLGYLEVKIFSNSTIQPSQFFSALESFQNTLHTLRLTTSTWHFGLIGQLHGDWPALHKLHLNGHFNGCSGNGFPFLDSFPGLSELVMFEDHNPHPISNVQDANVHDPSLAEDFNWHLLDQDNFYRSSIWTRLPDLQKVFFLLTRDQSGRYTRNTFQQRVAAGGGEPLEN